VQGEEQAKNVADLQQDKLDLEAKAGALVSCWVFTANRAVSGVVVLMYENNHPLLTLNTNTTKTHKTTGGRPGRLFGDGAPRALPGQDGAGEGGMWVGGWVGGLLLLGFGGGGGGCAYVSSIYDQTHRCTYAHTYIYITQAAKSKTLSEATEALKEEKRALEEAQHRLQTECVLVSYTFIYVYRHVCSIARLTD
jgi:hypothetical protein